ncbi:amino acid permease [Tetragenococcus muriaticus PMC-11-5]|uniref:Amino acid permease n=1 Tax=Tetragenococcus muriaticus PMC-11-5 TaxID=1302649 RepID=A0A091CFY1_9ENTE|nr:amino acid permease [Tetragenococcus muriaticus]KFN93708.1 amino acid permease [Tetragenococcus muriaticus PMC-11-5]
MENQENELKKSISFFPALATVMGTVIGAGVFFKTSNVAQVTGSTSLAMMAWFIGGIISICAGLTGAELAAEIPETGGLTKYLQHTYGGFWSFLAGWAQAIIYFPANVAALAIIFGTQVANLFGISSATVVPIAIVCAITVTLINFMGAKAAGYVQSITLVIKLIPLALIVVVGLFHGGSSGVDFSLFPVKPGQNIGFWTGLGQGLLATMFAYDGWIHVGNIAGEMKNPSKDLPKAISLGIGLIMVVYLIVNAVFLMLLPLLGAHNAVIGNLNVASDASKVLFGGIGGKIVTIGILISVYGTINGYTMTGMRIPLAMAEEHKLPFSNLFGALTSKTKIPWFSGIFQLIVAIIMILTNAFDALTNMLVFVIWLFYCMAFLAVMILRRREPELARPYKVPAYPLIPIIALLGGLFIVVNTLFTQFTLAAIGIVLTAIGIPFYFYLKKKYKFES